MKEMCIRFLSKICKTYAMCKIIITYQNTHIISHEHPQADNHYNVILKLNYFID